MSSTQQKLLSDLPYRKTTIIETFVNIDDMSPERLAWCAEKLFTCGAVDVWQIPAMGKKGRLLTILSFLATEEKWEQCVHFILKETSTFGIRYRNMEKLELEKHFETHQFDQLPCQVKVGNDTKGNRLKHKPEFEDLRQVWDRNFKAGNPKPSP